MESLDRHELYEQNVCLLGLLMFVAMFHEENHTKRKRKKGRK
jgi:hypothetical protein